MRVNRFTLSLRSHSTRGTSAVSSGRGCVTAEHILWCLIFSETGQICFLTSFHLFYFFTESHPEPTKSVVCLRSSRFLINPEKGLLAYTMRDNPPEGRRTNTVKRHYWFNFAVAVAHLSTFRPPSFVVLTALKLLRPASVKILSWKPNILWEPWQSQ